MKNSFKKYGKALWVLGILVVFQACYPGGSIPISDLDTTSTFYNTEDLATAPRSAAMVWDVAEIIDEEDPDNNIPYDGEVDEEILNTTLEELVKLYGETNVKIISETATPSPAPSNPNVEILVSPPNIDSLVAVVETVYTPSIMLRKQYVGIVYPGYPWWGGGWWGGWWGPCYYCGYPPQVSYQRFDVGSIIIDLHDLRQLPAAIPPAGIVVPEDFDPSWVGVIRGLLSSSASTNQERVMVGIQQAFVQSPYLKPTE